MCERETGAKSASAEEEAIEVTPEMIEAGLERLYTYPLSEPMEDDMRVAVADVFRAMAKA